MAEFKRVMGLGGATLLGIGALVGAGIFVLSGRAIAIAGPAAILAYLVMAVVSLLTAFCYCELSAAIPKAGGGYTFAQTASPGLYGFATGWLLWIGGVAACATFALAFSDALAPFFPVPWYPALAIPMVILFSLINYRGIKGTTRAQNLMTLSLLGLLLLVVLASIPRIKLDHYTPFLSQGRSLDFLYVMGFIYLCYVGFELISPASEEIVEPERTIPQAIMITLAVGTFFFLAVVVAMVGVAGPQGIKAVVGEEATASGLALVEVARRSLLGRYGALAVAVAFIAATLSSLNAYILAASHVFHALGRDANFPRLFGLLDERKGTPVSGIFITMAVTIALVLLNNIEMVAGIADFSYLVGLAMVNASVILLRRREPDLNRPYKVPGYPWVAILAVITSAGVAPFLSLDSILYGVGASLAGVGVYILRRRGILSSRRLKRLERRSEELLDDLRRQG